MPSTNALRDIIYGDPVGTETLTGMQTATPIQSPDEYYGAKFNDQLSALLPWLGITGDAPQFKSMADFIQLLRSLQTRLPKTTTEGTSPGLVAITPVGKSTPAIQQYEMDPFTTGFMNSRKNRLVANPDSPRIYTNLANTDSMQDPIESALNRLMAKYYKDWE